MVSKTLLLALLVLVVLALPLSVATDRTIPSVTQNSCAYLFQTCGNCSYVNITAVIYPNGSLAVSSPAAMTKAGTQFNYTFCKTSALGTYVYNTEGNPDGVVTTQPVSFEVTPTGYTQTTSQAIMAGFALMVILILAGFCFFIAFKFLGTESYWFYGLITLAFGLIFSMYALNLGLIYVRDIAYTTGTFDNYEHIFQMALRLETIVVWSSIILFLVYAYNLWKKHKKQREDNDGWDNGEY